MFEISKTRRLASKFVAALSVAGVFVVPNAFAQNYPNRPIKLIAPYPAGGGVDSVARLLGEKLSARLNQAIVIDNKPGAAGTIGADALAKSPADGYTLMLGSITDYAIAPNVHKSLGFDLRKDFAPIAELGYGTVVLVVNADFAARNVKELVAMAKAKPGDLIFASSGLGGLQHLNGEMFKQMAGVDLVHIPYKGSTQLLPDLLAGRVPMAFDSLPPHLPHIKSGKVRALAVASAARSSAIPDVPTMAEAGITGYESATNYTLFAPAGTSKDVVSMLNKEVNLILKTPEVREKLTSLGITITGGTVESVEKRIPAEIDKWNRVVKNGNLKFE
ncbi:MAG: tripartite tricarboxylate transporter substrate binding protein [Betaproteobacteria bacterium]